MKERSELKWVKSHQDADSAIGIKTLSAGTKLNMKANELATQGLNCLIFKLKVPLDPSSEVMTNQK